MRSAAERGIIAAMNPLGDLPSSLRRYLVDEELLSRTPDGTYWRSGGTVTVNGAGAAGEAGAAGGGRAAGGGGTRRPR